MTEQEWMKCADPQKMLEFLRGKTNERKLRLFKSTCCRRIWHLFADDRSKKAIEAVERFADGDILVERLELASEDARAAYYELNGTIRNAGTSRILQARSFAASAAWRATQDSYSRYNMDACSFAIAASESIGDAVGHSTPDITKYIGRKEEERKGHTSILRHIIGNPFRRYPKPASWSSTVVQLGESLYQGNDCRLPLSDALEEAGHSELADHFRKDKWHPKGCWAMDLVLGKN